jgi:hypothetical protein
MFDGMPLFYSDPTIDLYNGSIIIWSEFIVRDKKTKVCLRKELVQMTLNEFCSKRMFNSRLYTVLGRRLPLGGGDPSRWIQYHQAFVHEAAEAAMNKGINLPKDDDRLGLWDYKSPFEQCANLMAV